MNRFSAALGEALVRRRHLFGLNRRNLELVHHENPRRFYPLADDKLLAKERLVEAGVRVPETLCVCTGLFSVASALRSLSACDEFVVKPARGSGGDGILVATERLRDGVWRRAGGGELDLGQLKKHFADIVFGAFSNQLEDRGFVERRVSGHPSLHELWPDGLCDIRVLTRRRAPFMAMLRVPTRASRGRANLHSGGLGLAVDLATGRVTRGVKDGQPIVRHPDSGAALLGLELPAWDDILSQTARAAASVPLGYLGVDLVVDASASALVLEINARPGLEIQNVHGLGLGEMLARIG